MERSRLFIETRLSDSPDVPFKVRCYMQRQLASVDASICIWLCVACHQMCLTLSAHVIAGPHLGKPKA